MKKFFHRFLKFTAFPVLVLLVTVVPYIIADPFMDFGVKENYSWKYNFQNLGDLATKKLINSDKEYNSFIFGSSRSLSLYACYLNSVMPDASFFHYANWAEGIEGIYRKLDLLDKSGYTIDNTIIYLDADITFSGTGASSFSGHYLLTNKKKSAYLTDHFKSFYKNFSVERAQILLGLKVEGEVYPNWHSDPKTNDAKHVCNIDIVSNYVNRYRSDSLMAIMDSLVETGFLYNRPDKQQFHENQISKTEKEILSKIKEILVKHSTDYYVVITPLYDQTKFSPQDHAILMQVFGDRLFDFSGINSFTNNKYNFLSDRTHFQPYISKYMIDSILTLTRPDISIR
jgi:hypothetical protein